MPYESFPQNIITDSIPVTSFEEYMEKIGGKSLKMPISAQFIDDQLEKELANKKAIEARISNELYQQEIKELNESETIEDLDYFENHVVPEEVYQSHWDKGNDFYIPSILVYDEKGEIIGRHLYREKKGLTSEQIRLKKEIEQKYLGLNNKKWSLVEAEKEKELQQKVKEGKLVYLGDVSFEEYTDMIKKGLRGEEEIVVFDENGNSINDRQKIYAPLN